jgi:photosystem II stability/assembly factor-like uncharacterized protein
MQLLPAQNMSPSLNKQIMRQQWYGWHHDDPAVSDVEAQRWKVYEQRTAERSMRAAAPAANWQSYGPVNFGGRMLCHAFDPYNNQIILAGSASGGLWKTTNGGNSWTPMTDQLPNLAVGGVAIHPVDNNIILLGTGEAHVPVAYGGILENLRGNGIGILRSADGGLTWLPTSLTASVSTSYFGSFGFAWNPADPNIVCAATTTGLYRSSDAGQTWTQRLPGICMSVAINKQDPSIVYCSLQDYGASQGGIYRSTDGGITWSTMSAGLPASNDIGYADLTICDSFPQVLYTSISRPLMATDWGAMQGVYKTSDGGNTWSLLSTNDTLLCNPYFPSCQGWYGNTITVSPSDTNMICIGGVVMHKSEDGGLTWIPNNVTPVEPPSYFVHPDHHDMGFDPANHSRIYTFCDGGVYISNNGGDTWIPKNTGLQTYQFYAISSGNLDGKVVGGSQDNGFHKTDPNSSNGIWSRVLSSDGFVPVHDHSNNSTWYMTDYPSVGWTKTTNGGSSYFTVMSGITEASDFYMPLVIDPSNAQILYTASTDKIYKTVDGADSWSAVANIADIDILAVDRVNPSLVYACTKKDYYNPNSVLYRSTDAGATWTTIASPGNVVTDLECDPAITGTVYATRSTFAAGNQIYKSTNAGATWFNISPGIPGISAHALAINPWNTSHLYVATDLGVYASVNGGASWDEFNDNLPNVMVADIHYSPSDSTIRAGTYGRGLWITKALDPTISGIENAADKAGSFTMFPNPAKDEITIQLGDSGTGEVMITLLNSLGQKISSQKQASTIGKQNIRFDLPDHLSQGIYFIQVQVSGWNKTEKLIIQH